MQVQGHFSLSPLSLSAGLCGSLSVYFGVRVRVCVCVQFAHGFFLGDISSFDTSNKNSTIPPHIPAPPHFLYIHIHLTITTASPVQNEY